MANSITYDGVPSAQGGNIFRDMSFWVALQIPMRNTFLDMIKNNGGAVVPLEKQADMLIADCAKPKKAPPNSYSWKFIEDSVKNGVIQITDKYRIGPDPDLPRPVASGGLTRSTRTNFTSVEDAALAKWVLSHPADRTGNKIYQQFEAMNPRHTWQSWRNRFVKKLLPLSMEVLERIAASAPADETMDQATQAAKIEPEQDVKQARKAQPAPQRPEQQSVQKDKRIPSNRQILDSTARPIQVPSRPQKHSDAQTQRQDSQPQQTKSVRELPAEAPQETGDSEESQGVSQFQQDYTIFMQVQGLDAQLKHKIGSKDITLWNLLQVVLGQNVPPEEIDWIKAAEELGYRWSEGMAVAIKLRQCYEDNLVSFLEEMADYSSDSEGEEGDDADIHDEEVLDKSVAKPRDELPSNSHVPSSPPLGATGVKRPLETMLDTSPTSQVKRRRLNQNREIPTTPEREYQTSRSINHPQHQSPISQRALTQELYLPDSEASQQLPPLPRSTTVPRDMSVYNAQTQPIQENQQTPERLTRQDSYDVTPSQQLHTEDFDATAIHFPLDPGRKHQETSSEGSATPLASHQQQPEEPVTTKTKAELSHMQNTPASPTAKPAKAVKRSLPANFSSSRKATAAANGQAQRLPTKMLAREPREARSNLESISDVLERYESLGISNKIAVEALRRTTMVPGHLATFVIESLEQGNGIPSHHEGIWTDRDDKGLRLVSALDLDSEPRDAQHAHLLRKAKKEHARLANKHGLARMELRKQFLAADSAIDGDDEQA